jgi:hypothetical protein
VLGHCCFGVLERWGFGVSECWGCGVLGFVGCGLRVLDVGCLFLGLEVCVRGLGVLGSWGRGFGVWVLGLGCGVLFIYWYVWPVWLVWPVWPVWVAWRVWPVWLVWTVACVVIF